MVGRHCYWVVTLVVVMQFLPGCGRKSTSGIDDGRVLVMASILPLADFVREVGGDAVQVEVLVPPVASPHTYEPTPAQLKALSRAQMLVLNGIGLEFWAGKVIAAANNQSLTVVYTSEGQQILEGHEGEGGAHEHEEGGNPHIWLSPRCAMHQVRMIRDALVRADPDRTEAYTANADRYLAELRSLDEEIREAVVGFADRRFIAFHSAWAYLARDYGLEQAAIIERTPGYEPSPAEIASIIETARSIRAKAIFAEPQFSSKAAEAIAEESGAQVLFLNPLGNPPDHRYLELMRYNLSEISKALR